MKEARTGDDDVAAKFDGKRAGENHWVMQQNLAKQKGGRPPRWMQPPAPRAKAPKPAPAVTPPAVEPEPQSETAPESSAD